MVVLGIIGLLSIIIGVLSLIWLIVSSFTKHNKKPPLILLAVCAGIFIIDLISTSTIQENQAKAAAQSSSKLAASKSSEKKFSESLNKMGNEAAKEDSRKLKEGSSTSVSTSSSSTEKVSQPYGTANLIRVKTLAVSQDPDNENSQHFLVKHNGKYYLINYTGKDYYDSKGNEAVTGATISVKGDETGYGNVTESLVNENSDFETYQGQKVIIVESTNKKLHVIKAY